jgi:hypothetical protein
MIWKLLIVLSRLLFVMVLAWMLYSWFGRRRSARVISEGRIEFAPSRLAIWAWLYLIGFMATPAIKDLVYHQGNPWALFMVTCFGLAALAIFSSFPETIAVTAGGLEQIYWFQKNTRIRWEDIEEIKTERGGTITITGKDGTKIVHNIFLADRTRLLLEIKQHCGENLPPEFPREPIGGE